MEETKVKEPRKTKSPEQVMKEKWELRNSHKQIALDLENQVIGIIEAMGIDVDEASEILGCQILKKAEQNNPNKGVKNAKEVHEKNDGKKAP